MKKNERQGEEKVTWAASGQQTAPAGRFTTHDMTRVAGPPQSGLTGLGEYAAVTLRRKMLFGHVRGGDATTHAPPRAPRVRHRGETPRA